MPNNSKRGNEIGASPIRSLMPYANQAKAEGKHVFHLNIGQPDIETPPAALESIRYLGNDIVAYGPSAGLPSLRKKVANYYDKFDANLQLEDVFVTTGASEAILLALVACCDIGDEVIIPEPFYANYLGFSHMSSVTIRPLSTHFENGFALPSPSEFEALINSRTKAIFLCNPGNPTGQLYQKEELEELMYLVKKHDLFLIVDEVYREFCYDMAFTSVLTFESMKEHVVVIDSISKVFSSCGARIGYLITKNRKLQEAVEKYAQLRLCPPYFGQKLAEACYENAAEYIEKARQEYIRRREVLYDALQKIEGLECYFPQAAFYNICRLPVPDAEEFCKWMLSDFEHNGNTVMLAPANGFYSNKEIGKNQVRMAYILNCEDLQSAVECLGVALATYPKRMTLEFMNLN
jgi:aspartate aminotransferase